MASPQTLLLIPILTLLHLLLLTHATTLLLPLTKDSTRLQYITTFNLGTPPALIHLSLDLANPTNWIVGPLTPYNTSSTYKSVSINTTECLAYSGPQAAYDDCSDTPSPICNHNQCNGWASNPLRLDFTFSHQAYGLDPVVQDILSPLYLLNSSSNPKSNPKSLPLFPFVDTTATGPLTRLSQYSKGIVSLARNQMSLHSRISSSFHLPRKFALCLPSAVYFGDDPYLPGLSGFVASTPLVSNSRSILNAFEPADPAVEYYIKIDAILVDGEPVKFNSSLLSIDRRGDGGTRLSTMVYYTKLHSEIYKAVVGVFVEKAKAMKIGVVGPVSSFKTCFDSATIKYDGRSGSGVPVIELVMAGNQRWKIYGSNSMVKVASGVQCLAIFDAGPKPVDGVTAAVVIGGKQMEDSLVEFDLEASKLRVVSSLQRVGTSCSQIKGV